MSEETENPAQDLREVSSSWGNRLANCLMALAVLALMGAGVREYLIHNGKLTSDLNANGCSITNLPSGFFPVESVNGQTGAVVIPQVDLAPAIAHADEAIAGFSNTGTVERARSYGTLSRWTDATGCVWEVGLALGVPRSSTPGAVWDVYQYFDDMGLGKAYMVLDGVGWEEYTPPLSDGWTTFTFTRQATRSDFMEGSLPYDVTFERHLEVPVTNLVGRVALTNDIPEVPEIDTSEFASHLDATNAAKSVATPISNLVETVRAESALVYRLYQGSNVVAEVTNYNSQVHAPELRIMQLNESNEYITVWAETNGLARTLARAKEYADGATGAVVNAVAPRAWSKVTAGLGFDAPSNTTWLSTGRTVIAGGLEYEKHMTSGGAIWLLESNGMTADFHAQTNNTAFIDLSNADGTPIFRVEKTDSFLVGVHVDSVTVDGNALVCGVGVVAADHPLVRVKASLESGEWAKEEDGIPASLATVTWSGTTGNWTCRIQNNTGGSTLFAQMEYFQEGGTKIVNSAALDVSEGILCTDGIHKCRPVYSSAGGGTITWEVVQ